MSSLTQTALNKLRQAAKEHSRASAQPYGQCLEAQARAAGFPSWHAARRAAVPAVAAAQACDAGLPIDPELPAGFYDTANERRSKAELSTWWMRPYAVTQPNGRLDVRCLDGGAWDRPTYYGTASSVEEAAELARTKLAAWRAMRDTPRVLLNQRTCLVTVDSDRPGAALPVLAACASTEEVREFADRLEATKAGNPSAAAAVVRVARDRAAALPTYSRVERVLPHALRRGAAYPDGTPVDALAVAVHMLLAAFAGSDSEQIEFTIPEVAYYLSEFSADNEAVVAALSVTVAGRRVADLRQVEKRWGVDVWEARLRRGWLSAPRGKGGR